MECIWDSKDERGFLVSGHDENQRFIRKETPRTPVVAPANLKPIRDSHANKSYFPAVGAVLTFGVACALTAGSAEKQSFVPQPEPTPVIRIA